MALTRLLRGLRKGDREKPGSRLSRRRVEKWENYAAGIAKRRRRARWPIGPGGLLGRP
jgi:hypothetical protein